MLHHHPVMELLLLSADAEHSERKHAIQLAQSGQYLDTDISQEFRNTLFTLILIFIGIILHNSGHHPLFDRIYCDSGGFWVVRGKEWL